MAINSGYDSTSALRRVILISEPTYDKAGNLPIVLGQDTNGSQFNIFLSYLPPGISIDQIHMGQQWWIERRTTEWTLIYTVGGTVNSNTTSQGQLLPTGGTINQVLTKNSSTDYDVSWQLANSSYSYIDLTNNLPLIFYI